MASNYFIFLTVWIHLVLSGIRAEISCKSDLIRSTSISIKLQSDVLLPCNFNPTLLGSDPTADIAAVWSYKNITEENLVEISLQTGVMFWNNRGERINPFPNLSTSGNFSILLSKVNKSDLGLYQCELFNGFNCSIAYQEVYLTETSCRNDLIRSTNISTKLQSDVLLPCNFNPTLLGSDLTADIAAVWSYKNITEDNLMEISLKNAVMFWTTRGGRIKPFPKLSSSGNFSILLHKVNKSDLGLYRCELFNGTNCIIAFQEIYLSLEEAAAAGSAGSVGWLVTAGAVGGGTVLLGLVIIIYYCAKQDADDFSVYTTVIYTLVDSNKKDGQQ